MAASKGPILWLLFGLLSQWTNCQEQDVWSFHSEITIDSVDMATFRCPQSIYWRLQPGLNTTAFVEGFPEIREFHSNCIGNTNCTVERELVWRLLDQGKPLHPEGSIGLQFFDEELLMCNSVEFFHGINGSDRTPLTISDLHWQRGYIYTTGNQPMPMELSPNITISNPYSKDVEIRLYYLYDATAPLLYHGMAMHIEGSSIGCIILDHSEPRKWITTNMETIRIFFSSCSGSGRFGIGYSYTNTPGFYVANRSVVMDGDTPLTGQHTCSERRNRCPEPSPTLTPAATSTPFSQHSKYVTAQTTIMHAADSTVSPLTNTFPNVTGPSGSPVTNAFPDVTVQSVPPVTRASPDVTRQAFLPSVNTSGTGPQRAEYSGVGVVVGASIASGILLAVLVILILVLFLRKRKCLPLQKQPDPPQRIEPMEPTAPGMETLQRERQQSSFTSLVPPHPSITPAIVPGSSIRGNTGNMYAVVNRDRRQPSHRPPRPVKDGGLAIVENDLYSWS